MRWSVDDRLRRAAANGCVADGVFRGRGALLLSLLAVPAALVLAGCAGSTTSGTVVVTSTVAAPPVTTPTVTSQTVSGFAPPTPSTSTVVVEPPRRVHPRPRVVTRTVQAPQPSYVAPQPGSYSAALDAYNSALSVQGEGYYPGSSAAFVSPSGNIACYLTDSGASCAIHTYEFDQPGPDCNAGISATIDSGGYASLTDCGGYFPVNTGAPVLQYGDSVSYGDYACVSESAAISCIDFTASTGFSLSKANFESLY